VVDITAYARIGTGKHVGLFFTEDHPNLLRWWERIEKRPSALA
jgi:glutathione S-transferase